MTEPIKSHVSVTLADGADIATAASSARAAGLDVEQMLDSVGILTGVIEESAIERLRALPEVVAVEKTRSYQISPPDSPTQ